METSDQYTSMSSTLEMLRCDLEDRVDDWRHIENQSWHRSYLIQSLASLATDLDSIRVYVDSSQDEIKELSERVRECESRRDFLLESSQQKMLELKEMQKALKDNNQSAAEYGASLKSMQKDIQDLETRARLITRNQRQLTLTSRMEEVIFAHCTRLANPVLAKDQVHYVYTPLDGKHENDFVAKKHEYHQNWEELSQYHEIDMSKYYGRPKSRVKRTAPDGNAAMPEQKMVKRNSVTV